MSLANFIPAVWASSVLEQLQKAQVYSQGGVTNSDYQGDISEYGDRVHIHSIGDVTIGDYTRDVTDVQPELLTDSRQTLLIDQSKYLAFRVDDLDTAQQRPKVMEAAVRQAAYNLADVSDVFIAVKTADAGEVIDDGAAGPVELTAANIFSTLVQAGVLLDENNVPSVGRFAIVPPWLAGEILLDDTYVLQAAPEQQVLNGSIGRLAGFEILKSNNVPVAAGEYSVLAGHPSGITFAQQIAKMEAFRPHNSFSDAVKALHLYGAKVVRADALVRIRATQAP